MPEPRPIRLAIVIANPQALEVFFRRQVQILQGNGVEVHAICSDGPELAHFEQATGIQVQRVAIKRSISLLADCVSTFKIWKALRQANADLIHAHTPKAGLLGMIAAVAAGVKVRFFTFHGLRGETLTGSRAALVRATDWLTSKLATHVLAVSPSLRRTVIARGICPPAKIRVVGHGACSGLDPAVFDPSLRETGDREQFRNVYGIPADATVVGFAGRFAQDKGIAELRAAWDRLSERFENLWLFLCGIEDGDDPANANDLQRLYLHPRVRRSKGLLRNMPAAYAAMDILALPTYREGFGVVAIEAGAMQLPVVASSVDGVVDAVQDGVTGLLVTPRDATQLADSIERLIVNPKLRESLGAAARTFVIGRFTQSKIAAGLLNEYQVAVGTPRAKAPGRLYAGAKRTFDVLAAMALMTVTAPILIVAAAAVRLSMGPRVIFHQERGGISGKPFLTYKLRTMSDARMAYGALLPDRERLTPLGSFLRQTSIDELPQLWNVIKGDMSLVGPRPLLSRYVGRYNQFQQKRLGVRPGITGWAQIHGRNLVSWEEKFRLDVWYVEHAGMLLDLRILAMTALRVLRPRGISAAGEATMTEFAGTPNRA